MAPASASALTTIASASLNGSRLLRRPATDAMPVAAENGVEGGPPWLEPRAAAAWGSPTFGELRYGPARPEEGDAASSVPAKGSPAEPQRRGCRPNAG